MEGKASTAARAVRVLAGAVFAGWVMMWVMWPTNTYRRRWQPKIRADTNSTYFGTQGTSTLIYAFPVLFISVLGCVYIHLVQKGNKKELQSGGDKTRKSSADRLAIWKRPFLMKGPLGIVSYIEVAFLLMFVVLLLWCFCTFLRLSFSNINAATAAKHGEQVWESKLASAALRLGMVGNLCLVFLFFPVTRGSSLLPLVGLTSECSVRYHVWIGHLTMVLFTAHGVCYIVYWGCTGRLSEMLKWPSTDISNVAGELSLLFGLVIWATTFPKIRRRMFELFFYTHQLYALFLLFFLLHVGIGFICLMLPGIYLFMLDRFLRFLQSRQRARLVSARILPGETVELNFAKNPGFHYTTTSVVFVNVPSISKLQWHPFTVSSSCSLEPEKLSVIIKKEGSWTQKLYSALSSPSPLDRLDVSVEGPYGPVSDHFLSYDSLVLVSGGSGITPFIAMIRELIYRSSTLNLPTPSVQLVCAFKTSGELNMLDLLLPVSGAYISDISRLQLRIDAYVTREKEPTAESKKQIRTVWFKPAASDMPVYPVLGPNGWLWLAAIISSSFVAFLVLLGVMNRYYIFPIDQSSDGGYSQPGRAMLNLLLICVCIAGAGGFGVLVNKRKAASEASQMRITDAPTPETLSPGGWFYNGDRELESMPTESLVQVTKVQYGTRPNLKKVLLEWDAPNTGVLVSGPSAMRREAAAVCGSGLADNLHYESLSFSW